MKEIAIGIDIGGSHISCQLYNLKTNSLIANSKVNIAVDASASKQAILNIWVEAIANIARNLKLEELAGIGFAMPGPFDYLNGIAWFEGVNKFENLHGVNIKSELLKMLHLREDYPIRFFNDASCFAIGEANGGECSNYERIIALTLGTGFGSTFIKNKFPVSGIDGIPEDGFLYNIPFADATADNYFATRWFLKEFKALTGKEISGVKELAEMAKDNPLSNEIFKTFGKNLGSFLIPWIKSFNADCIVIGGNISKAFALFQEELKNQIKMQDIDITICKSTLDEDAALIGSAKLCDNEFYSKLMELN